MKDYRVHTETQTLAVNQHLAFFLSKRRWAPVINLPLLSYIVRST